MNDIDVLRGQIDEITAELIALYKRRVDAVRQIGIIKEDRGLGVIDEAREQDFRARMLDLSTQLGLSEDVAAKFLNFLLIESAKIQDVPQNTHLTIFKKAKELEAAGKKIVHMEVGEPDFMPPPAVMPAMQDAFEKGFVRYGSAWGRTDLRNALAKKLSGQYGQKLRPENILVTPGARFSVFLSIVTLLNPGDEIVVVEPAWPAYRDCASYAGVKVRPIQTRLEDSWEPDMQEIRNTINSNTRMIVLNYPNNPTGKVLPASMQDEIISIAIQNNLYVLSDEIYSAYSTSHKSILEYDYGRAIVVQSFSKSHAMTGFRIGYAVADNAILDIMASLQALCLTSVPDPMQYAALAALDADTSGSAIMLDSRLRMLAREAEKMNLEFTVPDGAMYLFARVPGDGFDATIFAERALEAGLAVAPGTGFGKYNDFIRISACSNEKTLKEGMTILNEMLVRQSWAKK